MGQAHPADDRPVSLTLRVHRLARTGPQDRRWTQDYQLELPSQTSLLAALLQVKRELDPSLAFRYSCGHGICGSDAVAVNGIPRLLCLTTLMTALSEPSAPAPGVIDMAPLPAFPAVRDLIVDLEPMLDQIRRLKPYLQASGALRTTPSGSINLVEYLQHPEELAAFDALSNCIACGVCEGACPIYVQGTPFVGPAALVAAARFIFDSRDGARPERLRQLDDSAGIWPCEGLRFCSQRCPRGIDVSGAIWRLMQAIKANAQSATADPAVAGEQKTAPREQEKPSQLVK